MAHSNGLTAVFSNLAKAAVKQQKYEVSELLAQLASEYAPSEDSSGSLERLREMLAGDIDSEYPGVFDKGRELGDRGALRAATWGEKVTKAQRGLVDRYGSKGESLLEDKQIFVCEACGFLFLGDQAPDICPVCKAPSLRFAAVR